MKRDRKLLLILSFNIGLMLLELAGGLVSRSLALISDAGHMLTDSLAVFLSYLALHWSRRPATEQKTFGYHRVEILVALLNGLALFVISGYIFYQAFNRFVHPEEIRTGLLLTIGVIGLAGNLVGLAILRSESHDNLNIRSAFFHLLADTLSSVGVILGGITIALTGWNVVDSLIGLLIGGIILRGAVDLIVESSEVLLEATPRDIDLALVRQEIANIPDVKEFHDIHIWTIGSDMRALSGHILTDNITTEESQKILCQVKQILNDRFSISHTTLEVECESCMDNHCGFLKQTPGASGLPER